MLRTPSQRLEASQVRSPRLKGFCRRLKLWSTSREGVARRPRRTAHQSSGLYMGSLLSASRACLLPVFRSKRRKLTPVLVSFSSSSSCAFATSLAWTSG